MNNLIIDYINKCKLNGFPNFTLDTNILYNEYKKLCNLTDLKNSSNTIGLDIIYHYHPSLWLANKKGKVSPYEAWHNDTLLCRCIENRLKYKGDKLYPKDILKGFSISGIAPKVSIFRPYLAKYIINKYLKEYDEIFDPFSGYSGRLLGASSLNKKYIGQDINPITIKESNNLIHNLNLQNITITNKNSLGCKGKYECLFTCPPYGEKENWNMSIAPFECDEWIDICLKNYKCNKYVFIVDKTEKYKKYIVEEISNKSHLNNASKEYILVI